MLPRLEAEETRRLVEALLAAGGRSMSNSDQRQFLGGLDQAMNPGARAPRATADQLQRMGIRDVTERDSGLLTVGGR